MLRDLGDEGRVASEAKARELDGPPILREGRKHELGVVEHVAGRVLQHVGVVVHQLQQRCLCAQLRIGAERVQVGFGAPRDCHVLERGQLPHFLRHVLQQPRIHEAQRLDVVPTDVVRIVGVEYSFFDLVHPPIPGVDAPARLLRLLPLPAPREALAVPWFEAPACVFEYVCLLPNALRLLLSLAADVTKYAFGLCRHVAGRHEGRRFYRHQRRRVRL
mmetsp:Transcript_42231/g.127600  ORF Transcript_42231/g.127600 Transcript_42231/m.127600 type:complete len:218 (+) Transcript_42231:290-943(+)